MTLHQCEADEAFREFGVDPQLAVCRQVGIIFTRDRFNYGKWVCEDHRNVFRLVERKS